MVRSELKCFADNKVNTDKINISVDTGACHCLRNKVDRAMVRVVRTNCKDIIATDNDCW
jgi:hypothetical protein